MDVSLRNGHTTPQSQSHIRIFFEAHFLNTTKLWADRGLAMTRERLMIATLKPVLTSEFSPKVCDRISIARVSELHVLPRR